MKRIDLSEEAQGVNVLGEALKLFADEAPAAGEDAAAAVARLGQCLLQRLPHWVADQLDGDAAFIADLAVEVSVGMADLSDPPTPLPGE